MTNTMTYKGYTASMIFDAEDKLIVGRVLDIDDIIAFHGESSQSSNLASEPSSMTTLRPPKRWAVSQRSPRAGN